MYAASSRDMMYEATNLLQLLMSWAFDDVRYIEHRSIVGGYCGFIW